MSTNVCSPHMAINTMIGTELITSYDYFEYCLQSVDWQSLLCNHPCATESYSAFISTLRCFIDECVPHKERVCVRGKRKCKPREVRRCDLKKRKLWRKLTTDPHDSQLQAKYRECCALWRRSVHNAQIAVEQRIVESKNLGNFFRHVNARLSSQANISCIMDGNTMVLDDYAKANVFNKYFASIDKIDRGPIPIFSSFVNDEKCMCDVTVTKSDVLPAICKFKANASSGPDGLSPVLFKHSLTTPLTLIGLYNQLLSC